MEEKISLPYIFHILESPLGCPNSLFLHDNGRLLHNNSRLFHDNGRLLWKTNGREKTSSISNSIINKDILRDLWKMEEVLYFFLIMYCPASA